MPASKQHAGNHATGWEERRIMGAVSIAAVLLVLLVGLGASVTSYRNGLCIAKRHDRYQVMNYSLLRSVCEAVGHNQFYWATCIRGNLTKLLWYHAKSDGKDYLIDISWLDVQRFRLWRFANEKKKRRIEISNHETNAVLQDVQCILEKQIAANNQQMKAAAVQQQEIIDRISPFMKDYVKSQVEIEG